MTDVSICDWDDAELIEAYDIGLQSRRAFIKVNQESSKHKNNKKHKKHDPTHDWVNTELVGAYNACIQSTKASKKDNKENSEYNNNKKRKWNVGDYCRALYSADGLYYEAKVIALKGKNCTVEFLGYNDIEDIHLLTLKESLGKKSQREQIKASQEIETAGDMAGNLYRRKKLHPKQAANNTTMYEAASHQQYPAPPVTYYAPPMPTNHPIMPPATMPQHSAPPAPPMPQCPGVANNPAFAAMLTSWYMCGYYTAIYSVQKENNGCQCCYNHSNPCYHN